ncbi:uncharacterized protein C1orf105 homolog [Ailuropoda melanoleuca]|uniref:uncharacterized protein C1orf105 homolog n=1 Tax=Ailuropoda melanoleuca TaxID=9646 RepID=UPI0014945CA0|nr:uncharacterized protein C1orf105 homolog [Ailuropoda melanoleuca]
MNFALAPDRKPSNEKALCSSLLREAGRAVPQAPARKIQDIREMEKRELKVSVPKFGKIPWLSEASLINKPLVLSLPKRYPHASATFLISSKKDMNLPILFQVPDVFSKTGSPMPPSTSSSQVSSEIPCIVPAEAPRNQGPTKRLLAALQPTSGPGLWAQILRSPCFSLLLHCFPESVRYRLPILGPRISIFHGLLTDTYPTLQETQLSSLPGKEPTGKTMR